MLAPKKTKYRKAQRGRNLKRTLATTRTNINFGEYALKSLGCAWITSRQIEAGRRAITREIKRGGKIWIRIFPHKPVTVKSSEVPMGSGKGPVDHYVAPVREGTIIFEMAGVSEEKAKRALELAAYKFPVKCKFVSKG